MSHFEALPMGFETQNSKLLPSTTIPILKHSLWDLKHSKFFKPLILSSILKHSLWDLKLFNYIPYCYLQHYFEALPMGFETLSSRIQKRNFQFWSTPYGIWNWWRKERSRRRRYFEALPMGFETCIAWRWLYDCWILKHSLWDLKLLHRASCDYLIFLFWSTPYGIWNSSLGHLVLESLLFWSTPYGIWN